MENGSLKAIIMFMKRKITQILLLNSETCTWEVAKNSMISRKPFKMPKDDSKGIKKKRNYKLLKQWRKQRPRERKKEKQKRMKARWKKTSRRSKNKIKKKNMILLILSRLINVWVTKFKDHSCLVQLNLKVLTKKKRKRHLTIKASAIMYPAF